MSTSSVAIERTSTTLLSRLADYIELSKPRIGVMVLVVVAVAYTLARWGQPQPLVLFHLLLGTGLVAGSASALNQWLERFSDALMERTAERPVSAGRISGLEIGVFATATFLVGVIYLFAGVGWQPAAWAAVTWVIYVWIYTPLKPRTWLNTAVGAVSGATPVLIGWSAGGAYDVRAGALFTLLFLWQFPHFMAIAWLYRHQYRRAGLQMLTVVDPSGRQAGIQSVACALALAPVSLVPVFSVPGAGSLFYATIVLALGTAQCLLAVRFLREQSDAAARSLLRASLLYLPAVLGLLLIVPWF